MGNGGGTPPNGAAISGAGGGRILPGTATGTLTASFVSNGFVGLSGIGRPGGGPGQIGTSGAVGDGAGGGGWGAAGAIGPASETADTADPPGTLAGPNGLGGAGGKAINTNGFAVTFAGGADRIYGVVG